MSQNSSATSDSEGSPWLAAAEGGDEPDWHLIAEAIPHIVWVARPDGSTECLNRQGTDYIGGEPDTDDWDWAQVAHADDVELARNGWAHAVQAGQTYGLEFRIRSVDGTFRWHAFRARALRGAGGEIVKWVGTATDIDDQKRYEDRLAEAQVQTANANTVLQTLQAAAPVGLAFVDRDFRFVQLNQALADMNGVPVQQHLGRTVAEMVPAVWAELETLFRHVLSTGAPVTDQRLSAPRGVHERHHDWLGSYHPVKVDGEVVGVGAVVVDVTGEVQAETFWSAVMTQVTDGVYAQDGEGVVTYVNRAASLMLGWSEHELLGESIHEKIHFQKANGGPIEAADCAFLTEAPKGRLVRSTGEVFTRKDGSTFPVSYVAMPLHVTAGVPGVAVVFRDASHRHTSPSVIRVLIADSNPTISEGVQSLLNRDDGIEVISVAATSKLALMAAVRLRPDVVVLDHDLSDLDGVATAALIKADSPSSNIILLVGNHDNAIADSGIAAGCAAVLDRARTWAELVGAVHAAHHGEATVSSAELQRVLARVRARKRPSLVADLTKREREVLACLKVVSTNAEAARRLGMTTNTVRNHVQRILYKLNVHSKLEAVVVADREGLLDAP